MPIDKRKWEATVSLRERFAGILNLVHASARSFELAIGVSLFQIKIKIYWRKASIILPNTLAAVEGIGFYTWTHNLDRDSVSLLMRFFHLLFSTRCPPLGPGLASSGLHNIHSLSRSIGLPRSHARLYVAAATGSPIRDHQRNPTKTFEQRNGRKISAKGEVTKE
jgi:hypothetical protein